MFSSENAPGFSPCYFTSPVHLFNIDDENSGGSGGSPPSLLQGQYLDSWNNDFSFIPQIPASTVPEANEHRNGLQFPVPLSSFFFQSLTEEVNYSPNGLQDEHHFAPGAASGEGEEFQGQFLPTFGSQASTPHNRRMIFPYKYKKRNGGKGQRSAKDEPQLLYRFFEFNCPCCEQTWLSPLFRAKNGCFCRTCHQFIMPRGIRHSFTPYLGKETCYGKYKCHLCRRGWSSYKSLSNCPDQCFQCGTLVYPYYQIAHSVLTQKMNKNEFSSTGTEDPSSPAKSAFLKSLFPPTQASSPSSPPQQNNVEDKKRMRLPRKITSISTIPHPPSQSRASETGNNAGLKSKKRLYCPNTTINNLVLSRLGNDKLKNCYSEPIIHLITA